MSSKATAIILARARSKGVPGKNTAPVAGRPCIAWTIEAAQRSARVDRVLVSSDDREALRIATSMSADTIERPAELAGDTARIDDAARHAAESCNAENLAILYANVPVRPEGLIDRALSLLAETGCDSVQSYQPVGKHHPWWTAKLDSSGGVTPWEGDTLNHGVYRRQDLPPALVPDGGVIALTRRALCFEVPGVEPGPHAFFGADRRGVENPEGSVVDIDSPIDLVVADALLSKRLKEEAA